MNTKISVNDLTNLFGDENITVVILDHSEWVCTCPVPYIPKEYKNETVDCFQPANFNGDGFGTGLVIKIWIESEE